MVEPLYIPGLKRRMLRRETIHVTASSQATYPLIILQTPTSHVLRNIYIYIDPNLSTSATITLLRIISDLIATPTFSANSTPKCLQHSTITQLNLTEIKNDALA